jgi:hypothetical protein
MKGAAWPVAATTLALTLGAATLLAHHSFAAEYDASKPVTLTGTITKVEWMNPHIRFYIDVMDAAGVVSKWELTMGGPNGLLRRGWTRDVLRPGETVTVDGYRAKDGSHLANARLVTLSNGRKMFGGTAPDAPNN